MLKHTLFIGLNDKDSKVQEVDDITAFKIVLNLVKKYYEGGTIKKATGFYTYDDGQTTIEASLELVILFADMEKTTRLASDIKTALNQESIALQVENIESSLIQEGAKMKKIYSYFCYCLALIFRTTTAVLKMFNFVLLIILILAGGVKVITGVK